MNGESTNKSSIDRFTALIYEELRRLAYTQLQSERACHTLQPTALVNEVYLRLLKRQGRMTLDRIDFVRLAVTTMRRILVDHARARSADKRSAGGARFVVDDVADEITSGAPWTVVELDEALERLAAMDARKAAVVELRVFGGHGVSEVAAMLNVGERTVSRDWLFARAWLLGELSGDPGAATELLPKASGSSG